MSGNPRSARITGTGPAFVSICNSKRVIPPPSVTDRDITQRHQLTSHSVTARTVFLSYLLQIETFVDRTKPLSHSVTARQSFPQLLQIENVHCVPIDPSFDITRQPCRHRQIHAPAWGATKRRERQHCARQVSIRAPGGRDTGRGSPDCRTACFTPRAHVGRDGRRRAFRGRTARFNPRARVGRDQRQLEVAVEVPAVSIHAPAWGATPEAPRHVHDLEVSIHAPAWGATASRPALMTISLFQSTRPRGARHGSFYQTIRATEFQSTRPRGARRSGPSNWAWITCFNPRARVGRDCRCRRGRRPRTRFNPRARVGRDRRRSTGARIATCFNPRARVGRD